MTHSDFVTSALEKQSAAELHLQAAAKLLRTHQADTGDNSKMTYGQWLDHEVKLQRERYLAYRRAYR